jgi:hypothetical protein
LADGKRVFLNDRDRALWRHANRMSGRFIDSCRERAKLDPDPPPDRWGQPSWVAAYARIIIAEAANDALGPALDRAVSAMRQSRSLAALLARMVRDAEPDAGRLGPLPARASDTPEPVPLISRLVDNLVAAPNGPTAAGVALAV